MAKNHPKNRFSGFFGLPKTSQNPPKIEKTPPKSDLKRSLFRDAMETARKSSQLNGSHSFWTTNLATHMIRSSPSIHPSIDLPLVALIIKACPATFKTSRRFLQKQKFCKAKGAKIIPKSSQNPSQISLNCSNIGLKSQTRSKCVPKPILNRFFVIFSNFLRGPGLPKSSRDPQNLGKNA